jgi:sulfur relay (sulfurtransferase) complex TusBCD TusD component (DsrE family)
MCESARGRSGGLFESVAGAVCEDARGVISGKASSLANPEEAALSTGVEVLGLLEIGSSSLGNSGRGFLVGAE